MQNIIVTLASNVQTDEDGNFLVEDDGVPVLKDEEDVGILVRTHTIQVNQIDNNSNPPVLVTGVVFKSEVLWNLRRCPSPAMEDPINLVWLTLDAVGEENDEEEEEEIDDNDGEEQEMEAQSSQAGH